LATLWRRASAQPPASRRWAAIGIGGYVALCVLLFVYFFPIWNGLPITWQQWESRMWLQGPIEHGWI
jgi:dolichyl-phosphate-mannose--protein O-mannosyl transferase